MTTLLGALPLVPLTGALVLAVAPPRRAPALTLGFGVATTALAMALIRAVGDSGPQALDVGGWGVPLGITLRADAFSAVMVGLTALSSLAVIGYATGSDRVRGGPMFWPLTLALWAGLNAVYVAGDLFNAYVALEVMGVSAVSLVALGGSSARRPALRYLYVAVTGSLAYLLGVALVYGEVGTLDIVAAGESLSAGAAATGALGLMTVGLALKTALFPLHAWLPAAHASAPSAVSPLMSALVVKASFYLLVRLWSDVFGGQAGAALPQLLGLLGAAAVLWGSGCALREQRLKRVVAYSTVAQLGYLFLLFPLLSGLGPGAPDSTASAAAWGGMVTLVLAHAVAKSAMFLAAGNLVVAYGSDDLAALQGAASRRPMTVMAFALAGVSLAGLPPSFGFVGKWQLMQASLASGQWWWLALLLAGGLLTFGYVVRVVRATYDRPWHGGPERPPTSEPARVPRRMEATALGLGVLAIVLGLTSAPILEFAEAPASVAEAP